MDISYKVKEKCVAGHKPYPQGMCNKCLPMPVVLNRQSYRHIDYVSMRNFPELQGFVNEWQSHHCIEQRVGFLYGYYSEDPNYPDGVRVNVEAVYEPPQMGEFSSFHIFEDPQQSMVDLLAESLTLECVGWVFTTTEQETVISPDDIKMIADMQEKHSIRHPFGNKVSKFVSIIIRPDEQQSKVDAVMVSDQCQALQRDSIFGETKAHKMSVREPEGEADMVPSVLMESKKVTEFDPEFFVVMCGHGQPQNRDEFNILYHYDFPPANRKVQPTNADLKGYLAKHRHDS